MEDSTILDSRISYGDRYQTEYFQKQYTDVLIDGRYAFREFAHFPHSCFKKNTVEYEFLYNGISKEKWETVCQAAGLNKEEFIIWPNQYGEGFWLTVLENIEGAVKVYDLLELKHPA